MPARSKSPAGENKERRGGRVASHRGRPRTCWHSSAAVLLPAIPLLCRAASRLDGLLLGAWGLHRRREIGHTGAEMGQDGHQNGWSRK